MSKVAHYLQQHLAGEVLTSPDVLRYFSTDESIFEIQPMLVVHPRSENDIRKAARFSWQLAERGRVVPITIKGKGTDLTGASLGRGIILSTPAHLNKIVELDPKAGIVTVEAGTLVGKLQQTLFTHGRFLPATTSSAEYATIGGAVANNEAGSSSYKYGPIREYVRGLRVILANGELIKTERLSKREFNKKLGLASFEGEIYRSLDKLVEESTETIEALQRLPTRSNVGYNITEVRAKDGSYDLTPLLVGSQGTLGLISEVVLDTVEHNAQTDIVVALFDSRKNAWSAVQKMNDIKDGPLAIDFIDRTLIQHVHATNGNLLKKTLDQAVPETALFIEIERVSGRSVKKILKKVQKILEENQVSNVVIPEQTDKDSWLALKDSASHFIGTSSDSSRAIPIIDDAVLPISACAEFIERIESLLEKYGQTKFAFWGLAGNGVVHSAPLFDVSQVGDRQKMFKLMDEYYSIVAELNGSIAGEYAEGRLRGSQIHKVLSQDAVMLMQSIKKIFDPFNTLNPGVKVSVPIDDLKSSLRNEYSLDHQYSHLPRS